MAVANPNSGAIPFIASMQNAMCDNMSAIHAAFI